MKSNKINMEYRIPERKLYIGKQAWDLSVIPRRYGPLYVYIPQYLESLSLGVAHLLTLNDL